MSIEYAEMSHWDRVVRRGLEHVLAVALLLIAVYRLRYGTSLSEAYDLQAISSLWSWMLIAAGLAILVGLHMRTPTVARVVEGWGWVAAAVLLITNVLYVALFRPDMHAMIFTFGLVDDLLFVCGAFLRTCFLWSESKASKQATRLVIEQKD